MNAFSEGYNYFIKQSGSVYSANLADQYVNRVESAIEDLTNNLNSFKGFATGNKILKGDIAEFWHSGTFNIDSAVKDTSYRTYVNRSHNLGSADITSNFGENFGLKYYATGKDSAIQQAKTLYERYRETNQTITFEEYLEKNGYSPSLEKHLPLYFGQTRIIPSDQLNDAIKFLKEKIAKEATTRLEQVERYKETLSMLESKISKDGVQSIELTKNEAELVTKCAKDGAFDPTEHGLTTEELIGYGNILNQAWKAGLSSMTISVVLKVAPEIVKAIEYLVINGHIDKEQFKAIGLAACSGASMGFIRGAVSASLQTSCSAGLFGATLKSVNPIVIGSVTVIALNMVQSAFLVGIGKKDKGQMIEELIKDMIVASSSLVGGHIGQIMLAQLPMLGFMLGSFVGSVLGGFVFSKGYNFALSFCVESGFTMFGLVDQNYSLSDDVLKEIGVEIFEYEKFEYETFEYEKFEYEKFEYEKFEIEKIDIVFLRRGVIGVRKIGYL